VEGSSLEGTWYADSWDPHLRILHRVRTTLFAGESPFQRVEVWDTHGFGRMLLLDGFPQAAETDEVVYAKAIAWPALLGVDGPKRVLITGGGDGHVLRETLRFPTVTTAVVCDIDPLVTEVTREHMPFMWDGAHRDRRAQVRHQDAWQYLASAPPGSFEVAISDITDPTGEGTASHHLYSPEYFERIRRCLTPGGICVAQAQELSVREHAYHKRLADVMAGVFRHVRSGHAYVPSFGYPEGFLFASDDEGALELDRARVEAGLRAAGLTGDPHFDTDVHRAMFVLPPVLRKALGRI
jgi:spermidine synthase